jgi:predicted dehydrogenase
VADVLRLGLAGAGVAGQLRAGAARRVPAVAVVAVADPDGARAERAARAAGGRGVHRGDDWKALVDRPDVDAVVVSTPTPLHEEIALAALHAGKHVLCEKPLAPTSAACRRLAEAARDAGRTLAVGFNHRYLPPFRFLAQALEAGAVGRLTHVRARAAHGGLANFRAEWMYRGALAGGGATMDIGLHMTDLVRVVAGEIAEVHGLVSDRVWRVEGSEDDAVAVMRSAAGATVAYHASWTEWRGYTFRLEAYGDRGIVRAQYGPMLAEVVRRRDGRPPARRWTLFARDNLRHRLLGWQPAARASFAAELADLAGAVAGRPGRLAGGVDGLRAVELAEAVRESSRRGAVVRVGA